MTIICDSVFKSWWSMGIMLFVYANEEPDVCLFREN